MIWLSIRMNDIDINKVPVDMARHGQGMELKAVPIDMCKTWIGTGL